MVGGLQEGLLVKLSPEHCVLAEVHSLVPQLHRLDALAHVVRVQASRVEKRVAARDLTVPPVGQVAQLRDVVLRRQEGQPDREFVAARQGLLDYLGDGLAWGVGPSTGLGPGLGLVGPVGNFAMFSPLSKIVLTLDMLFGRLELYPMLALFSPRLWRKRISSFKEAKV